MKGWAIVFCAPWVSALIMAQGVAPSATPSPSLPPTGDEETIIPTFETQKLARTYILDIRD
jgi:hypothetical protein